MPLCWLVANTVSTLRLKQSDSISSALGLNRKIQFSKIYFKKLPVEYNCNCPSDPERQIEFPRFVVCAIVNSGPRVFTSIMLLRKDGRFCKARFKDNYLELRC